MEYFKLKVDNKSIIPLAADHSDKQTLDLFNNDVKLID